MTVAAAATAGTAVIQGSQMDDFSKFLRLLEDYQQNGDWDKYLDLACSPLFQEDHAAWTARTGAIGATGPLRVLNIALEQAMRLSWIGDAATITLATAG